MTSPASYYTRKTKVYSTKRHEIVQPDDPSYRLIPLTKGRSTKVSTHRYDYLMQWSWNGATGYATRGARVGNKTLPVRMHRLILDLGPDDELVVDHINGDPLDNRDENLRVVTQSQNMINRKRNKDTNTGVKGVMLKENGKFQAYICLGTFDTLEEAKAVRDHYARMVHGEFFREGE